jgi:hypothetical protein
MYLNSCIQTFLFFHLSEMMRMHILKLLRMRVMISKDSYDPNIESVQLDVESVHPYADVEPEPRPKCAQTTLQDIVDLVGDPTDTRRNRYDCEEPHISITSTKPLPPRHIFLVQYSDPRSYGEVVGNPFWESTM